MAITLGTFTKFDNGVFTGTLKTLHVSVPVNIVPVERMSDKAPDHRVYAGPRHEIGAVVFRGSGISTTLPTRRRRSKIGIPVWRFTEATARRLRPQPARRKNFPPSWVQVAKSSGETYLNPKIGAPDSDRIGSAAAWSSSSSRPTTAPPTSPCGSRATPDRLPAPP
jgi:uncharacterized protein (DUF736 family)